MTQRGRLEGVDDENLPSTKTDVPSSTQTRSTTVELLKEAGLSEQSNKESACAPSPQHLC